MSTATQSPAAPPSATVDIAVPVSRRTPRVVFCTDTFHETNGVATISREFAAFVHRQRLDVMFVRSGPSRRVISEGSLTIVEVPKSPLCVPLDMGLRFDLLVTKHFSWLKEQLLDFDPDIVHITGPGDLGMLCARLSKVIRRPDVPLVAAWHTNVHQYARLRVEPLLEKLSNRTAGEIGTRIEGAALKAASLFYKTARLILAPNQEILAELTRLTGKPGMLMAHGVDTALFTPAAADSNHSNYKDSNHEMITLGYTGRLTAEKNVRFLAEVDRRLPNDVRDRVRFLIVGDGSERDWLKSNLRRAEFAGVLRDRALARAYTKMDAFLFPSRSDTFGLVVLEAMAAGVPVVAFRLAGPQSTVEDGLTGYTANDAQEFVDRVAQLVRDPRLRQKLGISARQAALRFGWDAVFTSFYDAYQTLLPESPRPFTSSGTSLFPNPRTPGEVPAACS